MEKIVKNISDLINTREDYLDFKLEDNKYLSHGYHNYPATMIPQLPKLFIENTLKIQEIDLILDPFMGSGTTLVEANNHNIDSIGYDLNPLSILMTKVKNTYIDSKDLRVEFERLKKNIIEEKKQYNDGVLKIDIPSFKNINYWFKEEVIYDLQIIKNNIKKITDDDIKDFFLVVFSEVVRYTSNSRNGEFKLYRLPKDKLDSWNPDSINLFFEKSLSNIEKNNSINHFKNNARPILSSSNCMEELLDNSVDLLITSPPYGDSKTTVAYGQFSRLSLQWLDLDASNDMNIASIDSYLLGGKVKKNELEQLLPSKTLQELIVTLSQINPKRSKEVLQFYIDLFEVLKEIKRVMKKNSYQFWVTANRTVLGHKIKTNQIIIELFDSIGIKQIGAFERNIPNKRMPSKNSPTNKKGHTSSTMKTEDITIFKKI